MPSIVTRFLSGLLICLSLSQCVLVSSKGARMGGPSEAQRKQAIAEEERGNFYYGRRYYVEKTRFWGYLRKPGESWDKARLVMMREDRKRVPDRLPEDGPEGIRYGYDQNYDYRIHGNFTGEDAYDPNSNQVLPQFMLTDYELLNRNPGWLFTPEDRYHPRRITLRPPR